MEPLPLKIESTSYTPFICLDKSADIFEVSGNSYPEDSTEFYRPVIRWLNNYVLEPNPSTAFTFSFDYFNSASFKSIYDILHLLNDIQSESRGKVMVTWYYKEGDTDIKEIGEELATSVAIPLTIMVK